MKYKIVSHDVSACLNYFTEEVEDWMQKGWTPQGGVLILLEKGSGCLPDRLYAYQAIIKSNRKEVSK